jgi:tRNA G18 (ribose-2'-O)-methylase SpoU
VSEITLVGITPAPIDRFGRIRPDFAKISLGAEQTITWEQAPELGPLITHLKAAGYTILALEQDPHSVDLFVYRPPSNARIALILGSEPDGLSPDELRLADTVVEIPMHGTKESLNVSVAAGIALYTLLRPRP